MKYILIFFLAMAFLHAQKTPSKNQGQTVLTSDNEEIQKILEQRIKMGEQIPENVKKAATRILSNGMILFNTTEGEDENASVNSDVLANFNLNGNNYSLNGTGLNVYIWDGGAVDTNLNELQGRVTLIDPISSTVPISRHATGVAGIIGATGILPKAKGLAPMANIFSSNYYGNFIAKICNQTTAILSNHSYGVPSGWYYAEHAPGGVDKGAGFYFISDYSVSSTEANYFGQYTDATQEWDSIAYDRPQHIMVKAAGNAQHLGPTLYNQYPGYVWDGVDWVTPAVLPADNCQNTGYDCIPPDSAGKNILSIGATNQLTSADKRYYSPTDVSIASYSSLGPRDDGAIKPDLVAVGTNVFSTFATGSSQYGTNNGTSFSAPAVTGVLALLNQLNHQKYGAYLRSDVAKALLINTTNECGTNLGPDYVFGWGLVDGLRAATTLINKGFKTLVENPTLNNGQIYEYTITADGTEPIKVTISWLDPAISYNPNVYNTINDRTPALVNDLDLKIIKISDNSQSLAWKLNPLNPSAAATTGNNLVDNVEQVYIANPTANAQYKIVVSHKASLKNGLGNPTNSTQFGLVASGIKAGTLDIQDVPPTEVGLKVYPNPVSDIVHFSVNSEINIKDVSVYDAQGKLVKFSNQVEEKQLSLEGLNSGVYILQITTEKGKITQNILKK